MKKEPKYIYGWKILSNYGHGHGWEYEIFERSFREARFRLAEYRANSPYPVKLVHARELNPNYKGKLISVHA